jgi:hypothetical protein
MSDKTALRPFQVEFPEADLTELRRRINATRLPGSHNRRLTRLSKKAQNVAGGLFGALRRRLTLPGGVYTLWAP